MKTAAFQRPAPERDHLAHQCFGFRRIDQHDLVIIPDISVCLMLQYLFQMGKGLDTADQFNAESIGITIHFLQFFQSIRRAVDPEKRFIIQSIGIFAIQLHLIAAAESQTAEPLFEVFNLHYHIAGNIQHDPQSLKRSSFTAFDTGKHTADPAQRAGKRGIFHLKFTVNRGRPAKHFRIIHLFEFQIDLFAVSCGSDRIFTADDFKRLSQLSRYCFSLKIPNPAHFSVPFTPYMYNPNGVSKVLRRCR